MTTEPFTPHADSIQTAWVLMCQQSRVSTQPPVEELEAEFDRFLARVRRDAAREALNRFAQEVDANGSWLPGTDPHSPRARAALNYRDTHYPEETP